MSFEPKITQTPEWANIGKASESTSHPFWRAQRGVTLHLRVAKIVGGQMSTKRTHRKKYWPAGVNKARGREIDILCRRKGQKRQIEIIIPVRPPAQRGCYFSLGVSWEEVAWRHFWGVRHEILLAWWRAPAQPPPARHFDTKAHRSPPHAHATRQRCGVAPSKNALSPALAVRNSDTAVQLTLPFDLLFMIDWPRLWSGGGMYWG